MNHQLHAAGFIEEAFGNHGPLRGNAAQRQQPGLVVRENLFGCTLTGSTFRFQPAQDVVLWVVFRRCGGCRGPRHESIRNGLA